MAVQNKKQTPSKPVAEKKEKQTPKKKQAKPEEDDEMDSELGEDDELVELEDDASVAPDDDDSEEDEEEAKKGKKKNNKKQKENTPAKGNKASPKGTPNGKQAAGAKPQTPELKVKAKEGYEQRMQRTVCVKRLKPTTSDEDIVKFFKPVGKCTVTKHVRNKALAMVLFDKVEHAEKALSLSDQKLQDSTVKVERSKFDGRTDTLKEKKKLRAKKQKLARLNKAGKSAAAAKGNAKVDDKKPADKKVDDKKTPEKKGKGKGKPAQKNNQPANGDKSPKKNGSTPNKKSPKGKSK